MSHGSSLGGQARAFFALGLALMIGVVAYIGRGVVIPFIFAVFLSFIIHTLKEMFRRAPFVGKVLPGWLCFLLAFALIGLVFISLIEIVRGNVSTLASVMPIYEERLRAISREAVAFLQTQGELPKEFVGGVEQLRQAALSMIRPLLTGLGASARSVTANAVTIFLYTVFLLLERGRIFQKIDLVCADDQQRLAVHSTIGEIGRTIRGYVAVKTASNLVTAAASYVVMLVIGVDFAGFWALLIFLLNFIPIVGAVSAMAAPVLLLLVQPSGGAEKALTTLVLFVAIDQIMSSAIEPRLMGRSLNLSPLVILLSLAVWGSLWGFAGMLLAVPISVAMMIVLAQYPSTRPFAVMLSANGRIVDRRRASAPQTAG